MRLADTLGVVTSAADLEETTFAVLGSWVPTVPEPAARALLAEQALHHAWHASLWRAVVPVAVGLEPADGSGVLLQPALELLRRVAAEQPGPNETPRRLSHVHLGLAEYRLAAYRRLLEGTSVASDGPVIRTLRLVISDQERDQRAGVELLFAMTADDAEGAMRTWEARTPIPVDAVPGAVPIPVMPRD